MRMSASFSTFAERLRRRLDGPLPGHDAHQSPQDFPGPGDNVIVDTDGDGTDDGAPTVVLTVRREELPDHAGQISFPGGQREGDETLFETALREAKEEVDLAPDPVRLLGALTPLYIPPSNFCVHPFVAVVSHVPTLRPTDREVGEILHVSLPHLLAPATRVVETWTLHGTDVDVPYYDVAGHTVWGATAMMLAEMLATARDAVETES